MQDHGLDQQRAPDTRAPILTMIIMMVCIVVSFFRRHEVGCFLVMPQCRSQAAGSMSGGTVAASVSRAPQFLQATGSTQEPLHRAQGH